MNSVLIVDDDAALRDLLALLLQRQGWEVFQAEDGLVGLEMVRRHRPKVVLCDLLMPRCSGFQFCRSLRADPAFRDTRVIATSGRAYATDRMNALEAGADEYLIKPVSSEKLQMYLNQLVQQADVPRAASVSSSGEGPDPIIRFWGVRGSIASPGPGTVHYGGNTACVEVRADNEIIVLDAGTGIRALGLRLQQEFADQALRLTLLISHTHWDHIQGFPFFVPAYDARNHIRILGYEGARQGLAATLSTQMESPYFPISMKVIPGQISIEEQQEMEFSIGAVKVKAFFVNHPGICMAYRLFTSRGSVVYMPDNEPYLNLSQRRQMHPGGDAIGYARLQDAKLTEFLAGADVLITDAQYERHEYEQRAGWGHSCVDDVVDLALRAEVKELILFHHDPAHDDETVTRMLASARRMVAEQGKSLSVEAAREGLEVPLRCPLPELVA